MQTRRADGIREILEEEIIEGTYKNGERLDELQLAKRFGVSRTPLREALQLLAGSGLLELIRHRGAYVRLPGIVELVEMFEVMAELEALCGRLAARRISPEELDLLASAAEACQRSLEKSDTDDYYRQNQIFHFLIYESSGNAFLASEARKLHKRLAPFRRMQLRSHGRMTQSMEEHFAILSALKAGDSNASADALRSHVNVQGEKFSDLLSHYQKSTVPK